MLESPPKQKLSGSKQRVSQLCQQILSPKAGYIRHKVAQLKNFLLSQQHQTKINHPKLNKHVDLEEHLREVRYLTDRLKASEEKALQYKATNRKMQEEVERLREVGRALEGRLGYVGERLGRLIGRFRKDYIPGSTVPDELTAVEKYLLHLESLLQEQSLKTEAESARTCRISKQLDALILKYKSVESHNLELTQQLDIQTKQRQIEQLDVDRIKQHFSTSMTHEQLKMKKTFEAELARYKEKAERRKEKNRKLKMDNQELDKEIRRKGETEVALAEELQDYHHRIQLLSAEVEDLKGMLAQASRDFDSVEDQCSKARMQLCDTEKELMKSNLEVQDYSELLKKTTAELEAQLYQSKIKEERLADFEKKNIILQEDINRLQKQLNNGQDESFQLRRQNKQLKDNLEDSKKLMNRQEEAIGRFKRQKEQLSYSFESELEKLRKKEIEVDLIKLRDSPKRQSDKSHKLKVIGELQNMVKTHKQLYQSDLQSQ